MKRSRIPPQILRLVLLTFAIVGGYLLARFLLTPASFGEYGWYRGAALAELSSRPIHLAGTKACEECHSDQFQKLQGFSHKTLSCEVCHGFGQEHVDNPDVKMQVLNYGHCVRCHDASPSKPGWFKQINPKDHYTGEKCTECHVPHAPSEVP